MARFFVRERLSPNQPLRGITDDRSAIDVFETVTRYEAVDPGKMPAGV